MSEVAWTKLFAFVLPNPVKARMTKCVCGGKNCQTAKKIKCVCRCHSEFHGAANRKGMEPLDDVLGLVKEVSKPQGSQPEILRFVPQVSRELIYIG